MTELIRIVRGCVAGMVLMLAVAELRAATAIYAGTLQGPYKSVDNGRTWRSLAANVGTPHPLFRGGRMEVGAVAVDPVNPEIVYAAVEFDNASGVLRSADGGQTWTGEPLPFGVGIVGGRQRRQLLNTLVIDPVATHILYLRTSDGGLYRSEDSAATWHRLDPGAWVSQIAFASNSGGALLAVSGQDLHRSTDFGNTWQVVSKLPGNEFNSPGSLYVHEPDPSVVLLNSSDSEFPRTGIYRSTDGGASWRNLGVPAPPISFGNTVLDRKTGNLFLGGGSSFLRSTDLGATWRPISAGLAIGFDTALFSDSEHGGRLFALTLSAAYRSEDGGFTWDTLDPVLCFGTNPLCRGSSAVAEFTFLAFPAPLAPAITVVSGASWQPVPLTPGSIGTALGSNLTASTANSGENAPEVGLAGTTVTIQDSAGTAHAVPLFSVSPGQITFLVPDAVAAGEATLTVESSGINRTANVVIAAVSPALFTLNRARLVKARVVRVIGDEEREEDIFQLDGTGAVVPRPVDLSAPGETVFLVLDGTGMRSAGTDLQVTIGGTSAAVVSAGPHGTQPGVDQVRVEVPRTLAGRGDVELILTAGGRRANTVRFTIRTAPLSKKSARRDG